jgi:hypothetical protein
MDILSEFEEITKEKQRIVKALEALTDRSIPVCEALLDAYANCVATHSRDYNLKMEDALIRSREYRNEAEWARTENFRLQAENVVLKSRAEPRTELLKAAKEVWAIVESHTESCYPQYQALRDAIKNAESECAKI